MGENKPKQASKVYQNYVKIHGLGSRGFLNPLEGCSLHICLIWGWPHGARQGGCASRTLADMQELELRIEHEPTQTEQPPQ